MVNDGKMIVIHLVEFLIRWVLAIGMFSLAMLFVFFVGSAHHGVEHKPPNKQWRNEMYKDGDAEPGDKSPYDGSEFLIL
jgi:hypothetical protein